ncbi:MAG: hypothetical protein H7Z75_02750 [Ferruginibacter sp.]|nr:hypothetical protein [Cytophagales bacterium]
MSRHAEQFNGREGETAALYERRSLNFTLLLAVSPHVTSAVKRFFEKTDGNVKNNERLCAPRKDNSIVCGAWFPATPRLTSQ